ncbi:MAG: exonuclease SbcCD subunit D [Gemmatimonadetes bacterium]|nr:exonuclease SbcCD subunit D [Gemmatimonadota bacterium]MYB97114.1 exonuclease SbcCD subunit D [Gemmatimonadota bacterium]
MGCCPCKPDQPFRPPPPIVKILHTADWHVGRTLRGHGRADEHRAVLDEIVAIAQNHAVDLVLVAGDQFDRTVPTPESEQIVYDALLRLARTGAQVVVIAGNHDNPRRLTAIRPLLDLANIVSASHVTPPDQGGVVRLATPSGETACIALFPFQSKRGIVKAEALMTGDPDDHQKEYADRCRRIADALCAGFSADTVNLVVAHLTVVGAATGGGERTAHIFDYYVPADIFPAATHYVALGHIHRPQRIPGRCPIRYAGSPFALDFGETHGEHSVALIEAEAGKPASVERIPLKSGRALTTIRGGSLQLAQLAGTTGDDFLRVIVEEAPTPGLAEQVRDMFPHAVDVVLAQPGKTGTERKAIDPGELRDPRTQFQRYLKERDIESDELVKLFAELLEEEYASPSP